MQPLGHSRAWYLTSLVVPRRKKKKKELNAFFNVFLNVDNRLNLHARVCSETKLLRRVGFSTSFRITFMNALT